MSHEGGGGGWGIGIQSYYQKGCDLVAFKFACG